MTTSLVPRQVQLVDKDGRISEPWYRYFQEMHQWSGMAGANFPLYDAVIVPALQMTVDGTYSPVIATLSGNLIGVQFDPDMPDRAHFIATLPQGYLESSDIIPTVIWSPATTDSGNVRWILEHAIAPLGTQLPTPQSVIVDSQAGGVILAPHHETGVALSGASLRGKSLAVCSIYRDSTATEDDYPGQAWLFGAGFTFVRNALGSQTEAP